MCLVQVSSLLGKAPILPFRGCRMLAQQVSLHFRMGLRILSSWTHPAGKCIRREVGRA